MNIDKDRIKTEIVDNDRYMEQFHKNPHFRKTIDILLRQDIQESELLHTISELCNVIKLNREELEKYTSLYGALPTAKICVG